MGSSRELSWCRPGKTNDEDRTGPCAQGDQRCQEGTRITAVDLTFLRAIHGRLSIMVRQGDVLLALGIAALPLLISLLTGLPTAPLAPGAWETAVVLMALGGLALIWWRKHPLLVQGIIFLLAIPFVWLFPDDLSGSGIAQPVISFCLGLRLPLPRATVLLTGLASVMALITILVKQPDWPTGITVVIAYFLSFVVPMLGGAMLASRTRHEQAVRRLESEEHEKRLAMTLLEERRRLAGELHDVAAHHLAGLVVQAAALEQLIDRDPTRARDTARQLRGLGKEALAGLRSVVKLLRHDNPQQGLRDIPELIDTTRALGVPITLRLAQAPTLPPLSDTAAYRIVQQAISNAIQHAPGATIHVEIDAEGLRVGNGPGHGEIGLGSGGVGLEVMRERAAAIGAAFDAGPTSTGGWLVRLTWPQVSEEET